MPKEKDSNETIVLHLSTTKPQMTREEADNACQQINNHVGAAGVIFREYAERGGWKAQGYKTFEDAVAKEFPELAGSRSQIQRLIQNARISEEVGQPVSTQVSRQLGKVPPEDRREVLEEAKGDGKKASGAAVQAVIEKRQQAAPAAPAPAPAAKPSKASKSETPAAPAKKPANEKYDAALERIGQVCGASVAKNIRTGVLANVKPPGAIFWAGLKNDQMTAIQELVVTKRWEPKKAHSFVSKMPDEKTKIADLQVLATAAGGATIVTTGAFATITFNFRKFQAEYPKIKRMLGLES